ncbi:MAG TPA: GDSL-type esterase/lipase family protein, partial [Polyangiaceae bacterium]|nr:GDSL-type esterase/lipase family protein [Polyangiaceae bacterium]
MTTSLMGAPPRAASFVARGLWLATLLSAALCMSAALCTSVARADVAARDDVAVADHTVAHRSAGQHPRFVASWSAAPMADGTTLTGPSRSFDDQTVRQIVRLSVGGSRVRIRLSNLFGAAPLSVGSAHVALSAGAAAIVADSERALSFDGDPGVIIPVGEERVSDPVALRVDAETLLAVSLYLPEPTGPATYHAYGNQTAFIAGPGDLGAANDLPGAETSTARYYLTYVEVAARHVGALVAIGDSIAEGGESSLDANHRWTDFLSERLNTPGRRPRLAVINQGIGCGRLLRDFCGPSAFSRFERDVLDVAGVTQVVLATGFVDIFFPTAAGTPDEIVSAEQIIAALRELASQAHQRGLEVFGATYTPNEGTSFENVFTPENEAKRQAVNRWMRTTRALDGVFD